MSKSSDPSPSAIREQIERLGRSPAFAGSDRLLKLLYFLVDETLKGAAGTLKESVVGNAVYGRDPPYDPRIDSTVRVEARRLRRKLDEYYEGDGHLDPVRISLPTGGYVPTFSVNAGKVEAKAPRASDQAIFEQGAGAAIAIMPFRSLSRDVEDESFANGLTDEVIFAMGRAQGLRVVSRTTTFQYKDRAYSTPALAEELGVDAILQGTVRRDGHTIRVTVEVSDPGGFVQWSDRFDAPDNEQMRLQERIAATVLSRMRFDSSKMRAMQASPGPVALEAHAKVYRARQLLDRQMPAALREAMEIFVQVVETAPDYARGHSGVADCYCDLFRLGLVDRATASSAAKSAVHRALEIDPRSVEAHAVSATISAWLDRDKTAAEANFLRALNLGENARTARLYGVFLTIFGRHEEAEKWFREARVIEPFSVQQDIAEAVSLYQRRHFLSLLEVGNGAGGQTSPEVFVHRALAHVFAGDPAAANALISEVDHMVPNYPDLIFARAEIEALLGKPERALSVLDTDMAGATSFAYATLAAALGDQSRTFDALERAVERRELSTVWLRTDVRFDRIREQNRFQALLEKMTPSSA